MSQLRVCVLVLLVTTLVLSDNVKRCGVKRCGPKRCGLKRCGKHPDVVKRDGYDYCPRNSNQVLTGCGRDCLRCCRRNKTGEKFCDLKSSSRLVCC